MSALSPAGRLTIPAPDIIKLLNLQKHPEGGYYSETHRQPEEIPSPFSDKQLRRLATTIYYFLNAEEAIGVFHINKSATMHVLHQGRVEYTLIYPENPPRIEKAIMGPDIANGEVLQLHVDSNIWKKSKILDEDLELAKTDPAKRDEIGCLITEVVFPGFAWEDHHYLTREKLEDLWGGKDGWQEWLPFVRNPISTEK
ncbi:hypothetical protein BDW22DRAFT_1355804 [Trametopsis cervina]|nr:hypothetical protein BDW22DRAFT_1355804 [Trametopsis cervina]